MPQGKPVKPLDPSRIEETIARRTGLLVRRMIEALSQYQGKVRTPSDRAHYNEFRKAKQKLYALYPDNPDKAQAIVRFAIVRAGWANKGSRA